MQGHVAIQHGDDALSILSDGKLEYQRVRVVRDMCMST
jgi:hypothetical protein